MSHAIKVQANVRASLQAKYPRLCHGVKPGHGLAPPDRTSIILGTDTGNVPVRLPFDARSSHVHLIGTTGAGKTKSLVHFFRQMVALGEGGIYIDPHGGHPDSAYRTLLPWLEQRGYLASRKVHVIDFDARESTIGFNPLARPDPETDISVIAGVNLEALSVSWDDENTAQKPTIERNLTVAFSALAELNLTLLEAPMLFDQRDEHSLRAWAIEHIQDSYIRSELRRLHDLATDPRRRRDFDMEIVGPMNRLARLLRPQALRAMVGQTKSTLDIREAMDEGHIILANLSGSSSVYDKDADLFGRLLTRLFLFHAKRRKNTRPFNMILDECQRYLSGDIPTLLAEVRKYAVPVLLSHQWLAQLETESANMLAAVMGGTNCKICFRIKDAEEAEQLAHSIIPLDLERPVGALIKPTVIGHKRATLNSKSYSKQAAETESQAKTTGISTGIAITDGETVAETSATYESTSKSSASSYADISGSGQGASSTEIMVPTGDQNNPLETRAVTSGANESANVAHSDALSSGVVTSSGTLHSSSFAQTHAETRSRSQTEADTIGKSRTRGNNLTVGISESLEPMLRWLPSAVHGKENMLYMAAQALRNLKTGVAYLNYVGPNGMVSTLFKVPEIAPSTLSAEAFNSIRSKALATSSAALATNQALSLISDRHAELSARCRREPTPEAPTRARGKKRW